MFTKACPELKMRFLWLAIGYALVVLVVYLSLTSSPVDPGLNISYEDKIYHAFAYFVLMAWFSQIYHDKFQRNMIAMVFIVMGFMMEYLQSFDPKRFSEAGDMLANTMGVAIGFGVALSTAKNILLQMEKVLLKS